jgi:hypothetical protein
VDRRACCSEFLIINHTIDQQDNSSRFGSNNDQTGYLVNIINHTIIYIIDSSLHFVLEFRPYLAYVRFHITCHVSSLLSLTLLPPSAYSHLEPPHQAYRTTQPPSCYRHVTINVCSKPRIMGTTSSLCKSYCLRHQKL